MSTATACLRHAARKRAGAGLPRRSAKAGPGLSRPGRTVDLCRRSSGGRRRGESLVRQCQPLRQQPRRLVWRLTVERHHGGRHARSAAQLRAPPVAHGCHLDDVRPPASGFFESMNGHVLCCPGGEGSDDSTLRRAAIKRSGTRRLVRRLIHAGLSGVERRKIFRCQVSPQVLHASSTVFPQHRPIDLRRRSRLTAGTMPVTSECAC